MTMKKRFLKGSIFIKLVALFLLASVVLFSIYMFFYASSMNLLRKERMSAVDTAGKEYLKTLDRQVENIKRAIYNTYALQDWTDLATYRGPVDDYTVLQQVVVAEERIRAIASTSEIVEEVTVDFPEWGRTISSLDGLKDFDYSGWSNIKMPPDSVGAQIVYYNGEAYLTSKYQLANPELFSITVRISFDRFQNLFSYNGISAADVDTYLFDIKTNQLLLDKTADDENENELLEKIAAADFMKNAYPVITAGGEQYVLLGGTSSYSGLMIVNAVKMNALTAPFTKQQQLVIFFMVIITATILLMFVYINRSLIAPINKMLQAFKPLEKGEFTVRLPVETHDEFGVLFSSFNHMVENIDSLVKEVYEKELLVQRANFKQLQSQINPHFLYNSFYALSTMIKIGDEENAIALCNYLSAYYQYITRNAIETVPIDEELRHAENYVKIMTMRNANIDVDFQEDLKEEYKGLIVPRLIVQPIIENAFEHGLKTAGGRFLVRVSITQTDSTIRITVEDNGNGVDEKTVALLNARLEEHQPIKEITGLLNIHKRLRIFFGEDSGVSVSKSSLGGLMVTVVICERREAE
jgi:two-component system sensor histidine kinase YesM